MSNRASLNHIYRTVWNSALGAMVAVAEIASSGGRASAGAPGGRALSAPAASPPLRLGALSLSIALGWLATPVLANPEGGVAVVGSATMTTNGNQLLVTTQNGAGGNYSAINWQSFSIPVGSTTHFQQPNAASTSINRVVTNTPSLLFGTLSSNGNIVLVNQAGIAVGTGAVVDTAGFTASALRMSDADALAGRLRFGEDGASTGSVSVQGRILARSGDVVLIGVNVDTGRDALIEAPNGSTILAAGQKVEITGRGLEGIVLQVQAPTDAAVNLGTLKAGAVGMFAGTLRHSGAIHATTATMEGGKVVLKAVGDAYVSGDARIDATSATGKGGSVAILGNRVAVTDRAVVDVAGATGGGEILVGGDYQGKNAQIANSTVTYVGKDTQLLANAGQNGDGGKVIVWSDGATRVYGTLSAKAGSQGGNGGLVETSGHWLDVQGINVDASAAKGKAGQWLLDPYDITVTTSASDITPVAGPPDVFASGVGASNVLNTDIQTRLNAGTSVTLQTTAGGGGNGDITVSADVSKSAGGAATLTLQAHGDIVIAANKSISSSVGALNVVLNSDSDASGSGAIVMNSGSSIVSNGGNITLGGGSNPLTTAAVGNASYNSGVTLASATLNAGAGNINIRGQGVAGIPSSNSGVDIKFSSSLLTTSGNITVNGTGGAAGGVYSGKSGVHVKDSTIQTASGAIALTGTGGNNGTASDIGVYLEGGAVKATSSGTVAITGTGGAGSTGGLNYGVFLEGGTAGLNVSSVSGSVSIDGTATGDSEGIRAFSSSGQAVNVTSTGSASISLTGAGAGTASQNSIRLDGSSGAITIGGASASGAISFVAGGVLEDVSITNSGVSIQGTGTLSLKPLTSSTSIGVGSGTGSFTLDAAELGALANGFSSITIGGSTHSGLITVGTSTFQDNLTLETTGGISFSGALTSSGNTVTLKFGSTGVTQSAGASVTASGLVLQGTGMVTMTESNVVSTLSATLSGNTNQSSYWNSGALTLGAITSTAGLNIKTGGGALTQSGAVTFSGSTTTALDTGGGAITLTNAGNQLQSLNISNGGVVSIVNNSTALTLGTSTTTSLNVYSVGNLNLAGAISATAAGDAVVLRTDGTMGNFTASISTPNGRWLAYVKSVAGHSFVSTPSFKQFNAAYGTTVLGTGNGVLYDPTVVAVLSGTLAGSVTKPYDGTTSVSLSGAELSGATGFAEAFTPVGTVTLSGTGTLADPNIGTGISTTASNATVNVMVDAGGLKVYGYKANASGAIGEVTKATLQPFAGMTLADFADKFETLLIKQDTKDDRAKGTDGLVVEGEICRI